MKTIDPIVSSYLDERDSSLLYQTLSEVEKDPRLAEVYKRISATEAAHAETWKAKAGEKGLQVPEYRPSGRIRTLIWLGRRFGTSMILPSIQGMEQNGTAGYAKMSGASKMMGQEQAHAKLIDIITGSVKGGLEGGTLAQIEGRHRSGGGNALRAAVLGANDGLVSNLSLVMGVAGATLDQSHAVLIAGVAGLLAGAISMALGEWLSVTSSRELYKNQIATEAMEIEENPEEEIAELTLIYESRGIKPETAKSLANQMLSDKSSALDTLSREELGINPQELGGSAWEAAITSFLLFAVGAILPVAPFIFLSGYTAVFVSIGLSIIGLFLLGAAITLFTGRTVLYSGMRMVVFGLIAAGVTFGIGRLIGGGMTGG
jgi:VIT1/CCC1 family predicted Fe2+/Mn2+ transporter